jgi:hypothetical protein
MAKLFHGRYKKIPEIVVHVQAETAGKARYLIYLKAREAFSDVKIMDIQVRVGQCLYHPLSWDDVGRRRSLFADS